MDETAAQSPDPQAPPVVAEAESSAEISSDVPDVALDDDGCLTGDMDCRRCGYNLRGLRLDGRCPECETAVGRSVHGDLLRYCEPDWVEELASGMKLFVVTIMLGITVGIVFSTIIAGSMIATRTMPQWALVGLVLCMLPLIVIEVLAYWKITTPDPGRDESEKLFTARAAARLGLIFSSLAGLVNMFVDPNGAQFFAEALAKSPALVAVLWIIAAIVALIGLVGMCALFIYARSLALRMRDKKLARSTQIVMWGYLIPTGLTQAATLVHSAMLGSGTTIQVTQVFGCVEGLIMLPGMVFVIWGIVLLFQYRNRLILIAGQARDSWAAEDAGGV